MPFIAQGKTNLKYILIVIILAIIVGGGIYWMQAIQTGKKLLPQQIDHKYIVSKVIINLIKYEPPQPGPVEVRWDEDPEKAKKLRLGEYEAEIGFLLTSPYDCPRENITLQEFEGSILGSHRIEKAVTYFLPRLETTGCRKDGVNQYKLYTKWSRRSDTDWTIVVPGYFGLENIDPEFKLYKFNVTKEVTPDPEKTRELEDYVQNFVQTSIYSLTNNPGILSIDNFSVDKTKDGFLVAMTLQFANPCMAEKELVLDTELWGSKEDNTTYIWANILPGVGGRACPAIYSPVEKKVEFFFPDVIGLANATILIPNYPSNTELPFYIKKIRVHF